MKCKFLPAAIALLMAGSVALSCKDNSKPGNDEDNAATNVGDPIKVVGGMVRFFIDIDDDAPRVQAGVSKSQILGNIDALYVNGKEYPVSTDEKGNLYSDVYENSVGTYSAALTLKSENKWFGSNPGENLTIPCGQFYGMAAEGSAMTQFPMFGNYSEATGNRILLTDIVGILRLHVSGSGSVVSVKLQTENGTPAGMFLRSGNDLLSSEKATDFIVLNCTEDGNNVEMGNDFDMFLAPGNYENARLVICDSEHRVMRKSVSLNIEAGKLHTEEVSFSPDENVLWYDGFDLCVWGGNIMGGSSTCGFSPSDGTVGDSYGTSLTGKEYALAPVDYNKPGSGYIQPNNWTTVNGSTVGAAHQMSESYVKSRNISDYNLIFRAQEFQGMIGVSYHSNTVRGILASPAFGIEGPRNVKVTARFCPVAGFGDDFLVSIKNGGKIISTRLDGNELPLSSMTYKVNECNAVIGYGSVEVPADMASPNEWHTLELTVQNAVSSSYLHICGNTVNNVSHCFLVDEIEVTDLGRTEGNLRVLYWNIQNGMWADQANNYDNFVEWVKQYDPDVCVWCESASIYKDNTSTAASASEKYLPEGWTELAKRYGHNYSALGGYRDNYPQEITSKYPITTLLKITDSDVQGKPISHGAAVQQLDVNGKKINVVTLHMWPQAYAYGVSSSKQEASKEAHEGDYYREFEMKYILSHTVNASEFASQTDWLMMGDFNSRSPLDEWYYNYGESSTYYLCQNVIRNGSDMVDIIGNFYPGDFQTSTYGLARIDYMYASPSMYAKVRNAVTVIDPYTILKSDTQYGTTFHIPSDHRPIMVDFEF